MARHALATDGIEQFDADLHGDLILPGDPDYDVARSVWNGMIDRRPAMIARCRGVADVITAVTFGREHDVPVSVRGGGHNVAGTAVCDDGLVIDLSEMRAVWVDPDEHTAWVQGGATWADVDHETQQFGLATPGGVVSKTGVAGLTLGGGIGHLRCAHGLSCDNVRSFDVVTADGAYITASVDAHEDLYWALCGGGGGLGVVTGFEFACHSVGPEVATCLVFYEGERIPEVLAAYREYVASAPDAVTTLTSAGQFPDDELFPADVLHEGKLAILGCYAGPTDEGEEVLAPLREIGTPLADYSDVMAYVDLQQLFDPDYPDGMRYYWKSLYLDGLSDSANDRIAYWAEAAPSPLSTVDVWQLGGAIDHVPPEESAFPGRGAPFLLGIEANWEDPDADEANVEWVRDCIADMRQFSDGGVYLNFPGFFEDEDAMMETTFGPAVERLRDAKAEYDPKGLFGSLGG